jgi:hypothetical protein
MKERMADGRRMERSELKQSTSDLVLAWLDESQGLVMAWKEGATMHGVVNGHHGYERFDICTVAVCGQQQRGARATCGYEACKTTSTVAMNTFAHGMGDDSDKAERVVARKFEAMGWLIGKTAKGNRCPACFGAIKQAAMRKKHEREKEEVVSEMPGKPPKVVQMKTAGPNAALPVIKPAVEEHRGLTREDRRIIFAKLNDLYLGEAKGYAAGWNDARIAKDLGVPPGWVAQMREENFGPNIDEASTQMLGEARAVLAEIRTVGALAEPIVRQLNELADRCSGIERWIKSVEEGRKA